MMREVKFKVWDNEKNKMYKLSENFYIHEYHSICFHNKDIPYNKKMINLNLLQYTNLKDINGKEIYEGDILSSGHTWNLLVEIEKGHTKIKWHDKSDNVNCSQNLTKTIIFDEDLKIISNKYENPELIENG